MVPAGVAPSGGAMCLTRAARRSRARVSADRLVHRLSRGVDQITGPLKLAESALSLMVGNSEVGSRLRAVVPAVLALVSAEEPKWLHMLHRNVALHSDARGIDVEHALVAQLRRAQHGARLEARKRSESRGPPEFPENGRAPDFVSAAGSVRAGLRRHAAPFWPQRPPGVWGPPTAQLLVGALGCGSDGAPEGSRGAPGPPPDDGPTQGRTALPLRPLPEAAAEAQAEAERPDVTQPGWRPTLPAAASAHTAPRGACCSTGGPTSAWNRCPAPSAAATSPTAATCSCAGPRIALAASARTACIQPSGSAVRLVR
ncbi:unnamed protein product [Prorocentrum cordatum]|uniref:Uncharacterized protein n=1 Tax=Prorocentrum cordatum TaxID=2364126 RepID=A0ABN9TFS3_9DINO|nr:unnamed protein product [Polarella glacialis]